MTALEAVAERLRSGAAAASTASEPAWLTENRDRARRAFAARGLPTPRDEEWRYTNLAPLAELSLEPAEPFSLEPGALESVRALFDGSRFVFANGRAVPELSSPAALPGNARCESLATRLLGGTDEISSYLGRRIDFEAHPFAALNTASLVDGAAVHARGGRVELPVQLVFAHTGHGTSSHPRTLVVAEDKSEVIVVQDHVSVGADAGFTNAVVEVHVGAGATVHFVLLQREHERQVHISNFQVHQDRDSHFSAHTLSLSGRLVRNDLGVVLAGEGAECTLDGLTVAGGKNVVDHHTEVDHAVPHTTSTELYKGVLGGSARGVFRGRVVVHPDAQKIRAAQSNHNLLIGSGAEADSKPQLEIYADDVQCSHGATIGRLDENALFYLRARALSESRAREILTRAFALEVLERLPGQGLSDGLDAAVDAGLRRIGSTT